METTLFKRENGIMFTTVIIKPVVTRRKYIAEFKVGRTEKGDPYLVECSIGGNSQEECIEAVEMFLKTKLEANEYSFNEKKK